MRKRTVSIVLSIVLLANVTAFYGCGEDTVKFVKQKITDIVIYADSGINLIEDLREQDVLPADKSETALLSLREIKAAGKEVLEQGKDVTKINTKSKEDWLRLFGKVSAGVTNFVSRSGPDLEAILTALNVPNPEKWAARIRTGMRFMDTARRLVESRLSN